MPETTGAGGSPSYNGVCPVQLTQLGDASGQHSGGVQVSECGGWGRICQIVSRHVDSLHRRDGALLGGGDALLHGSHVRGQCRLITHS